MTGPAGMLRGERIFLAALLLAGFILHMVCLLQLRENPFFEHPILDEAIHYQWAAAWADGEDWFPGEPFFRAPLYPLFLSFLFRLFGPGFLAVRIVQVLIAIWNPVLVYFLGRRLFSRTAGGLAAAMFVFHGMTIYFNLSLLIVSILLPLDLLLLLFLLHGAKEESVADKRPGSVGRPTMWLLAGLFLGLSAIARPNILLFGACLPFWIAALPGRRHNRLGRAILPFLLGTALPILPVFLHNVSSGDPVLIAWQGGTNFYIGNNRESDGMTAIAPGTDGTWWGGYGDLIRIAETSRGKRLARSEVSSYWFGEAWRFMREDPESAARLMLKKSVILAGDFEVSNNQGIYFLKQYSTLLTVLTVFGFGIILPLGGAGAMLIRWNRENGLLALFLLSYALSIVLFFVTARYRMPLIPPLLLLGAAGLLQIGRAFKRESFPRMIAAAGVLMGLGIIANSNPYGLEQGRMTQGFYNVGVVYLTEGRYDEATAWFEKALAEDPGYRNARYDLGLCHVHAGRPVDAEREFRELVRLYPEFAEGRQELSGVLVRTGRPGEALQQMNEAIRIRPDHPDALWNRGLLRDSMGDSDGAGADWERALSILLARGEKNRAREWTTRLEASGVDTVRVQALRRVGEQL